jgi:hypothetical protein
MMTKPNVSPEHLSAVAREAKTLVALAFRNGPIEDVHAGKVCPTCDGKPEYSHITQDEMRLIMKAAVDRMHTFLLLKENDKAAYEALLTFGARYTTAWDEPVLTKAIRESPARHQNRGHYRSRAEEHEGCGKGTLGDEEDGGCSRAIPVHVLGQQNDARCIHLLMKGSGSTPWK